MERCSVIYFLFSFVFTTQLHKIKAIVTVFVIAATAINTDTVVTVDTTTIITASPSIIAIVAVVAAAVDVSIAFHVDCCVLIIFCKTPGVVDSAL